VSFVEENILLLPFKHKLEIIAEEETLELIIAIIRVNEREMLKDLLTTENFNDSESEELLVHSAYKR
jgi:uncharacterized protein YkvS